MRRKRTMPVTDAANMPRGIFLRGFAVWPEKLVLPIIPEKGAKTMLNNLRKLEKWLFCE